MPSVIIQSHTTKNPITMIGEEAGICWGSNITDVSKNYKRGIDCLENQHGRTFEFPDVYMIIDGYSARVIREWYTHIGGMPTRMQGSTRYIEYYKDNFSYVTPPSIANNPEAKEIYDECMDKIVETGYRLERRGIPKEDIAMVLPLAMETKVVCKHNLRNLMDMSHQPECSRAYHEYRELFKDVKNALRNYSEEWAYLIDHYFMPKCEYLGYCPEKYSCGRKPKKSE